MLWFVLKLDTGIRLRVRACLSCACDSKCLRGLCRVHAQVKAADSVGDRFVVEGNPFDSVRVKNAGVEAAAAGGLHG